MFNLYRRWQLHQRSKSLRAEMAHLDGLMRVVPKRIQQIETELLSIELKLLRGRVNERWYQGL